MIDSVAILSHGLAVTDAGSTPSPYSVVIGVRVQQLGDDEADV